MNNKNKVRLIDVTLRDAHQCLWATRMTTAMMKPMAPFLDDAGFEAIDLVSKTIKYTNQFKMISLKGNGGYLNYI